MTKEQPIIGRIAEQATMRKALQTPEAELVAVLGRRRVGKTFLIEQVYRTHLAFDLTGSQNGQTQVQLQNFVDQLEVYRKPYQSVVTPANWSEAFKLLRNYLQEVLAQSDDKAVVVFDEFPWLAGKKSGFLEAFSYFWNSWASKQSVVVVICGSAAAWMIKKVVNHKGGLHNRITQRIFLEPFTLHETESYLLSRGCGFDRYQIAQLYMALGGIPHYLKFIDPDLSAVQNLDAMCFTRAGALSDEFERLYTSLFAEPQLHMQIVRTLAQRRSGMTRAVLVTETQLTDNGKLTETLEELVQSGFLTEYLPFSKKKTEKVFRLTDFYSVFYLDFIEQNRYQRPNTWLLLSQTQAYKTWSGFAFETICLMHVPQIKQALGIAGIYAHGSTFYQKAQLGQPGMQVDLLLDRSDNVINLIEVKFYNAPYELDAAQITSLQEKIWQFQAITKSKKQINWVFVSSYGLANKQKALHVVTGDLKLEHLFRELMMQ